MAANNVGLLDDYVAHKQGGDKKQHNAIIHKKKLRRPQSATVQKTSRLFEEAQKKTGVPRFITKSSASLLQDEIAGKMEQRRGVQRFVPENIYNFGHTLQANYEHYSDHCGFCTSSSLKSVKRCSFCGSCQVVDKPKMKYVALTALHSDPNMHPAELVRKLLEVARNGRYEIFGTDSPFAEDIRRRRRTAVTVLRMLRRRGLALVQLVFRSWVGAVVARRKRAQHAANMFHARGRKEAARRDVLAVNRIAVNGWELLTLKLLEKGERDGRGGGMGVSGALSQVAEEEQQQQQQQQLEGGGEMQGGRRQSARYQQMIARQRVGSTEVLRHLHTSPELLEKVVKDQPIRSLDHILVPCVEQVVSYYSRHPAAAADLSLRLFRPKEDLSCTDLSDLSTGTGLGGIGVRVHSLLLPPPPPLVYSCL